MFDVIAVILKQLYITGKKELEEKSWLLTFS